MEPREARSAVAENGSPSNERRAYLVARPYIKCFVELCAWNADDAARQAFGDAADDVAVIQMVRDDVTHGHRPDGACNVRYINHPEMAYHKARRYWRRASVAGFDVVRF